MVSRRKFLAQLTATGALAPFAHLLPKAAAPAATAINRVPAGVLTHKGIEATYLQVTTGYDEPDLIFVKDIETYRRLVRLVQNVNDHPERWHWETVSDEPQTVSA